MLSSVFVSLLLAALGSPDHPRFTRPFPRGEDWLQFNAQPASIKSAPTASTLSRLHKEWRVHIPEPTDGSPAYVAGVGTPSGRHDLLVVTTLAGRTMALDALDGEVLWSTTPPVGPRWTTSSPAVDPRRSVVYSYGLDGYVHRYLLDIGEELTGGGWPQLVTLKPTVEKMSSALSLATTVDDEHYLYVTISAYPEPGDEGDYQGHLVTIDLDQGTQKVFNVACSNRTLHFVENGTASTDCKHIQSGIWARAGAVYDAATNRVFMTTGNGDFDAHLGGYNWGDSIVALRPDGSGRRGAPLDSYTPVEYQLLQDKDLDLSSTTVAILELPQGANLPRLAVQGGKDGVLRLVDLANLSGQGGPRHVGGELQLLNVPQGGAIFTRPATWLAPDGTSWVFVATNHGISGLALTTDGNGTPALESRWVVNEKGTSPIIVNGVLYVARDHELSAYDTRTGEKLWSDDAIGTIHWQSPIIVNNAIFIADNEGYITAYTLDASAK
jgi:hypothetical protein